MDDLATPTAGDLALRSPGVMHRWVATAAMSRQLGRGCEKFLKCTRRMRGGKNHGFFLTHQFLERWKTMDKVCLEVDIYPKSVVSSIVKLVGGFKHEFYCPFHIWDVILPIDEVIYFKMVKITNQLLKYTICRPRVHNYCFSVE